MRVCYSLRCFVGCGYMYIWLFCENVRMWDATAMKRRQMGSDESYATTHANTRRNTRTILLGFDVPQLRRRRRLLLHCYCCSSHAAYIRQANNDDTCAHTHTTNTRDGQARNYCAVLCGCVRSRTDCRLPTTTDDEGMNERIIMGRMDDGGEVSFRSSHLNQQQRNTQF